MARILVVEDEPAVAELLALNLRHAGHDVALAVDGQQAQQQIDTALPDLVLLDWMLPGSTGTELLRRWRGEARTRELPVIMVTARAGEADLVRGLDAGADDYLVKPFSPQELLARLRALLRRHKVHVLEQAVTVGPLTLDPATRRVRSAAQDGDLRLGPTEFRLLHYLMTHAERVHSRSQLLDQVWGDHVFIEERTVDVHIKRLRECLAPGAAAGLVQTVRGAGYRVSAAVAP